MTSKVYPVVDRKSLTELYYEALATAQNAPGRAEPMDMVPEMQFLPPANSRGQQEIRLEGVL